MKGLYSHVAALGTPNDRFYMPTEYTQAERQGFISQAIAAGISESEIATFLQYNPGDEHRIIDALLDVRREDYSAAHPETAPVIQPRYASGELVTPERSDASIYATYQRSAGAAPSIATSGPPGPMGYASFPSLSGYAPGSAGASGGLMGGTINLLGINLPTWLLLLAAGGAAYYFLTKK